MPAHTPREIPRAAMRGVASGVVFMAFFGTVWASIGVGGLAGWAAPWPTAIAILGGLILLGGGVALWHGTNRVPAGAGGGAGDGAMGRKFGLIFGLEGAAIALASVLCNATGNVARFVPIMALIVGLHFFPLAALFDVRPYYLTGALLGLVGLAGLVAVPAAATLGGHAIMARWLVVGGGCAAILWATGIELWLHGSRLLRGARPA